MHTAKQYDQVKMPVHVCMCHKVIQYFNLLFEEQMEGNAKLASIHGSEYSTLSVHVHICVWESQHCYIEDLD